MRYKQFTKQNYLCCFFRVCVLISSFFSRKWHTNSSEKKSLTKKKQSQMLTELQILRQREGKLHHSYDDPFFGISRCDKCRRARSLHRHFIYVTYQRQLKPFNNFVIMSLVSIFVFRCFLENQNFTLKPTFSHGLIAFIPFHIVRYVAMCTWCGRIFEPGHNSYPKSSSSPIFCI